MLRRNLILPILLVIALLASARPSITLAAPEPQSPQGLRPDAPTYAVHGPYAVGARDFVIMDGDHKVSITVWYPALNPSQAKEEMNYQITDGISSVPDVPPAEHILKGRALQAAPPDTAHGPYPLVVFSPGLAGFKQQNGYLLEHLASYGFVVMSWDPRGETLFGEFWAGAGTRPVDTKLSIAYAEKLTAIGGELAGLIDMTHIGVSGHSSGGWAALAGGGAQMDFSWCAANPALVVQNDGSDCNQFVPHQQEIAAIAGLKAAPAGMWPPMNDPRVEAVLALAPDGDIWGANYEGVAAMRVPTMIMAGSKDTINVPEYAAYPIYEHLGSAKKSMVVFENADHFIFFSQCRDIPWVAEVPYFICADAVWNMDRVHNLINHFATAFLLAELKGDAEAAKALAPAQVAFPGIRYKTASYTATAQPTTQLDSATSAKLETIMQQGMTSLHAPGMAIGVMKLGGDQPVTPQSVFQFSSIAKTATSTAIMQLVEQGKIELDTPVTKYLPYFQLADERYKTITIRQLLTELSGLPDYTELGAAAYDDGALERYVRSLSTLKLNNPPGVKWDYSHIGYDVLGDVVAKMSGQSFEDYAADHIFKPLGMTHSTFLVKAVDPTLLVSPHVPDATGKIMVSSIFPYNRSHAPDTTLYSNVEDMARYLLAHLNQGELDGARILKAATYAEIWKKQGETYFEEPEAHDYGLGWVAGPYQGHRLISHLGLDEGFNTYLALFPEEKTGFVLLVNSGHFDPADGSKNVIPVLSLARPLFDLLLGIQQ